jgi:hypothetical protein
MTIDLLPASILEKYEVREWKHACAILKEDFPEEWRDLLEVLDNFTLKKSHVLSPGGGKSKIAQALDSGFFSRGWKEKSFDTSIKVDEEISESPTHSVDCFKNAIAIEVEWNNKDPFYDRDLNNFRLLYELRVISVGIIITRSDELQTLFNDLGKGHSYGPSTTHMSKLLPRIQGGGGGGCPLLVFGITRNSYEDDDA